MDCRLCPTTARLRRVHTESLTRCDPLAMSCLPRRSLKHGHHLSFPLLLSGPGSASWTNARGRKQHPEILSDRSEMLHGATGGTVRCSQAERSLRLGLLRSPQSVPRGFGRSGDPGSAQQGAGRGTLWTCPGLVTVPATKTCAETLRWPSALVSGRVPGVGELRPSAEGGQLRCNLAGCRYERRQELKQQLHVGPVGRRRCGQRCQRRRRSRGSFGSP